MLIKRKKLFILLACIGLSEVSFADNPSDNCRGAKKGGAFDYCQDGNTLTAVALCGLSGAGSFQARPWGACRVDFLNGYNCSSYDGVWEQGPQWGGHNEYTCRGPRYNFDIVNKTSYAIKAIYYDAPLYNEHSTDHSGYIVTNYTPQGDILHTNPDAGSNDQALVIDTDYGENHLSTVGTLAIFSPDINEDHSNYGVALATIQQHNPLGGHDDSHRYIYNLSSTNENHGRQNPKQFSQTACVLAPSSDKQYATYDNDSIGIKSPPGKSVLLPNFIEARIDFCTNSSSFTTESYTYSVFDYRSLNITDTKLVPRIESTSGYISNPSGFKGTITYNNEIGEKCIPYNFVIKTQPSDCKNFENNESQSAINDAYINVSVSSPNKATEYFQLKFNSKVFKVADDADALYTMILDSQPNRFTFVGESTLLKCNNAVCKAKILLNL